MEKYLAVALTLGGAFTYLSGYGFLWGYYQFFDVGVWELHLSVQDVLSHSASSFLASASEFSLLYLIVAFFCALVALRFWSVEPFIKKAWGFSATAVLFFVLFTMFTSSYLGRSKAKDELRLLNKFHVSNLDTEVFDDSPLAIPEIQMLHLATTEHTFFVVGVFESGNDRWVGRVARGDGLSSFVYQDP